MYITDIAQKNVNKTIIWHREYKSRQYFIPSATVNNNSGVDWITASTLCRSTVSGANLVSMITDTLQIYLQSNLPTAYHYWTSGISDVSYRWPSGMYQLPQLNEWFVLLYVMRQLCVSFYIYPPIIHSALLLYEQDFMLRATQADKICWIELMLIWQYDIMATVQ